MTISKEEMQNLKEMALKKSPLDLIQQYCGSSVKQRGNYITGEIRADTRNKYGKWQSFSGPTKIGDNIALYEHLTGGGFKDAIQYFTGVDVSGPIQKEEIERKKTEWEKHREAEARRKANAPVRHVNVPEFSSDPTPGRTYLLKRGITPEAILEAERQGAINYTDRHKPSFQSFHDKPLPDIPPGVAFLGRDSEGTVKYVAMRYFDGTTVNRDGQEINKKDLPHSSKETPMTLLPRNRNEKFEAYVVEGGLNALATLDMCIRGNKNAFIMTTGGVSVRQWLENKHIVSALALATKVTFIGEYETLKPGQKLPENAPDYLKKKNAERALPDDTPEVLAQKRLNKQKRIDRERGRVISESIQKISQRRKEFFLHAENEFKTTGKNDRRSRFFYEQNTDNPFNNVNPKAAEIPQIDQKSRGADWKPYEDISDYWLALTSKLGRAGPQHAERIAQDMKRHTPQVPTDKIQYLGDRKKNNPPQNSQTLSSNRRPILSKKQEPGRGNDPRQQVNSSSSPHP